MYQYLALDIDGTLTNNKKEITPLTLETLIRAQQKGVRIILASGRPLQGIMPLAKQLEMESHGGFIMAYNGGQIVDLHTGKIIVEKVIPMDIYPYLYEMAHKNGLSILSYLDQSIISEDTENQYVQHNAMLNRMPLKKADDFLATVTFPEPKFLIVGHESILKHVEVEMQEKLKGVINVFRSEPFFLELVPLGVEKASSLELLLQHIGASRKELMAIGDGFNDVGMMKYAGLGIAMGNAQEEVKAQADFITADNEEDGVAVAVEKFILKHC